MRTASIRQPWAWLIATGRISVVSMDWGTDYRGPFLIRSGLKVVQRDYRALVAQLRDELHLDVPPFTDFDQVPRGGIVGIATLVDVVTDHPSPLYRGPFGWVLRNAQPLPFVECTPPPMAQLAFFDVPCSAAGLAIATA